MSYTVGSGTGIAPASNDKPGMEKPGEKLSLGVAARLSRYLQVLTQARKMDKQTISSQELADYTHVNSTQIRKILRTSGQHNIALFGAGHLGTAIATSDIFADHGFRVVAVFDNDEGKVGTRIGSLRVRSKSQLRQVIDEQDIVVAVLAVPAAAAQDLADEVADAGVKIIVNDSDALIQGPPEVTVHTSSPAVDLLYALYFYLT